MVNHDIYDFYIPKYMELGIGSAPNKNLHNYYLEYVLKKKEVCVLEVGYGTGLLTIPLLKEKIKVIAIDKSNTSKLFLNKKCQGQFFFDNLQIETIDIIEYNSHKKFNTIIATDEFLIHFLSSNQLDLFLKKVSQLLNINGEFVTDIRNSNEDEFTKLNCYPIYTLDEELEGVKYIRCTSWNNLSVGNIVLVNYKYEELDSSGRIINSFIRILRQGKFSFEDLRKLATKNDLSLSIKNEVDLDCSILQFIKIK